MGDSSNNQELRIHGQVIHKHNIPYLNIMLSWIGDILDKQIQIFEAKGFGVAVPLLSITSYLFACFANIHGLQSGFDIAKNIVLSLIGIAMGAMTVINTYIGMVQRIKKYKESKKPKQKNDEKSNVA